jgi:6-phosphogluconolactonase
MDDYYLFVGTYSPANRNGLFVYRFHSPSGKASFVSAIADIPNPTSLAISPDHHFLFAVSETDGNEGGIVYAYVFDQRKGKLDFINKQLSGGKGPCNIALDKTGHWLFVANYEEGSFSVLPVNVDGQIVKANQTIQHCGRSIDPEKQGKAHVHCVLPGPLNKALFVADLGMDQIFTYKFDADTGRLSTQEPLIKPVTSGSGPRHLSFSPDGKYLYLIQEIGGCITAFAPDSGKLTTIQTIPTIPEGFEGKIWAAEIQFSPDGRFLYACNRDDLNDIVTYAVDIKNGRLTYNSRISSMGKTPRNFTITPAGRYLLVGHRSQDVIVVFKRDVATGALALTNERIPVEQAVCLRMIPIVDNPIDQTNYHSCRSESGIYTRMPKHSSHR